MIALRILTLTAICWWPYPCPTPTPPILKQPPPAARGIFWHRGDSGKLARCVTLCRYGQWVMICVPWPDGVLGIDDYQVGGPLGRCR